MAERIASAWLPSRDKMSGVSYDAPGYLLTSVRDGFLARLRERIDIIETPGFREWAISSGQVPEAPESDAFIWFGEIGRDHRREYNLELLKSISMRRTVINSPRGYEIAMDKYLTGCFLKERGIPVPPFALLTPDTSESFEGWGGPVLIKPRLGSYGIGIVKAERPSDAVNVIDYSPGVHYVEKLIPNDPAEWIGINIIGGEHAYSYRKGPESFHDGWKVMDRKKIGGKMLLAEPSATQLDLAKRIASLLDMAWVGVDIITDGTGAPFVVDVNAFPGLYPEMFAQAGKDGPQMLADAVFRKMGL